MARLVRPTWAIRCTQSGCRTLFEVVQLEEDSRYGYNSYPEWILRSWRIEPTYEYDKTRCKTP